MHLRNETPVGREDGVRATLTLLPDSMPGWKKLTTDVPTLPSRSDSTTLVSSNGEGLLKVLYDTVDKFFC
jgi:hypothetical protein